MESLQSIQRRIKGVKNINQITKAMELTAANKMRRSQEVALASRPYAFAALDLLANLSLLDGIVLPPILEKRAVKNQLIVLVASDKGLAGSFNSSVVRAFEQFLKREGLDFKNPSLSFMAVGQKVAAYLERRTPNLKKKFTRVGDYTTLDEVEPLAQAIINGFLKEEWDETLVFSTHFKSALNQKVFLRRILPADFESLKETALELRPETGRFAEMVREEQVSFFNEGTTREYLIEPSAAEIMEGLARHLVLMQVYHLILEANASEHAARRVAMKNASDNAEDLAGKLTLQYNKSRQAVITKEIIEIVAGAEAMK